MAQDVKFDPVAKRKGHSEDVLHLSQQDCATMADDEFRGIFISIVSDLVADRGIHTLADELPFVARHFDEIATSEMRDLVFANQEWFNPKNL
jgi:hypothetical protein